MGDVLLTSQKQLKVVDASDYKSLGMLLRYLEVSRYYSSMDGLLRAKFAYPKVQFRYVVSPSEDMPSSMYPLNLKETDVQSMIALGKKDAADAIAAAAAQSNSNDADAMTMSIDEHLDAYKQTAHGA